MCSFQIVITTMINYVLFDVIVPKLVKSIAVFSNNYIYITIRDNSQKKILKKIDMYLKNMIVGDYNSFISDKYNIKVKNNKSYNINDDIYISLNNLKQYNERWKLHIFTI